MARTFSFKLCLIAFCASVSPSFAIQQPLNEPIAPASSKAGWALSESINIQHFSNNNVSWLYSWGVDLELGVGRGLGRNDLLSDWQAIIQMIIKDYELSVTAAFGPNEPDIAGPSALTPAQAVSLWQASVQPFQNQGIRLGAPAITSSPAGQTWLSQFISGCSNCTIDFIPIHHYGTDANEFLAHLESIHKTFGKNIWITKFACQTFYSNAQNFQSEVNAFGQATHTFLDSASYVERYESGFDLRTCLSDIDEVLAYLASINA